MNAIKTFVSKWWPTMIVVGVIVYATLNSNPVGDYKFPRIPHIDKWIHAIMFGGLFSALAFDYYRAGNMLTKRILITFAIAAACAGAIDECAQAALENGRSAELLDFVGDCFGIFVAYLTAPPAIKRVVKKHS